MLGHKDLFVYATIGLHLVYIAVAFGLLKNKPETLGVFDFWVKVYMGIYLVWRFNPFIPASFNEFDRKVVFAAGTFLITITIVNNYFRSYLDEAKSIIKTELLGQNRIDSRQDEL